MTEADNGRVKSVTLAEFARQEALARMKRVVVTLADASEAVVTADAFMVEASGALRLSGGPKGTQLMIFARGAWVSARMADTQVTTTAPIPRKTPPPQAV